MGSGDTPDAFDVSRELAWEVKSVRDAVDRYRKASEEARRKGRDIELPPARRALIEAVGPVSSSIHKMQDEAISAGAGKPPPWHGPFLAFQPDVLSLIAVASALRVPSLPYGRVGQTVPAFARRVCAALRDQADHDRFVEAQLEEAKAKPDGGGEMLRRFRSAFPSADRRAWTRFAAKIEGARSKPWDEDTRLAVGSALSTALATGSPDWFELAQHGDGPPGRNPMCVLLTPRAVEKMADADVRAEVARPLMLPMIVKPNPWRYAPPAPLKEAA